MALIGYLIAGARRTRRNRHIAANGCAGSVPLSCTNERDTVHAHVESQQWVERAIQRTQSPETRQFLSMISSRIEQRIRTLDAEGALPSVDGQAKVSMQEDRSCMRFAEQALRPQTSLPPR